MYPKRLSGIIPSMKSLRLSLLFVVFVLSVGASAQTPIVVELFTSEGCSSCPTADALLVQLSQMKAPNGTEIIVLGEHVDYWNHIGWTDRFSSPEFTSRQQGYARQFELASPYTPQMVIDGQRQLVGNDRSGVEREITQETKLDKPATVSVQQIGNNVQVAVRSTGAKGKVFLAVTEDGLSTEVRAGENGGRTLHHAGVVRELRSLGSLSKGDFDRRLELSLKRDWNPANLKIVVFVQQGDFGPILGAASVRLSQSSSARLTEVAE